MVNGEHCQYILPTSRATTLKLGMHELWSLHSAGVLAENYPAMKCDVDNCYSFWNMAQGKLKYKIMPRAITLKLWYPELWFWCSSLLLNEIYLPMEFHVDIFYSFWDMAQRKLQYKMMPRAITQKLWNQELWFLHSALLLNEIYLRHFTTRINVLLPEWWRHPCY